MTLPNMDKYRRAQQRIRSGDWVADAEAGLIYNARGQRIGSVMSSGYIFLSMTPALHGAGNQNVYAHRVIWESLHGPIPDGLRVNHINGCKADNRIANLELVTESENMRHAHRVGLNRSLHGEASPNARISRVEVQRIRERAAAGETQQSIADAVGLSRQQVGRIVRGERWAAA